MLSDNELIEYAVKDGYDRGAILEPEACRQYLVKFIEECRGTLNSPNRIFMMGYSRMRAGVVDMRIKNQQGSLPLPMDRLDRYLCKEVDRLDRYLCKEVCVRSLDMKSGVARVEFYSQPAVGSVNFSFLNQDDLVLKKVSDLAEDIDKCHKKLEDERRERWGMCRITAGGVKETLERASKRIRELAKLPPPPQIIGFSSPEEKAELDKNLKEKGYTEVTPNHWERKDA